MNDSELIEGFGRVRQLGHVVADIDESIAEWTELGVGPWMLMRRVPLNAVYLGEPSVPIIDVALSYRGDVQIELIRQHNDAPSPYLQTVQQGAFCLHHRACLVNDIDRVVEQALQRGLQMVCDIHMVGSRYVYLKDGDQFIELLPNSLMMRGMFATGARACRRGSQQMIDINMNSLPALLAGLPIAAFSFFRQQFF